MKLNPTIKIVSIMAMGYYLSCTGPVSHISPYQYTGDKAFKSTIYRDNMGVPHIFGNTDADAVFGLAYAHAEDDFKTIQDLLMGARGILASEYGAKFVPVDFYVHFIGVWDDINTRYDQEIPEQIKMIKKVVLYFNQAYLEQSLHRLQSPLFHLVRSKPALGLNPHFVDQLGVPRQHPPRQCNHLQLLHF